MRILEPEHEDFLDRIARSLPDDGKPSYCIVCGVEWDKEKGDWKAAHWSMCANHMNGWRFTTERTPEGRIGSEMDDQPA